MTRHSSKIMRGRRTLPLIWKVGFAALFYGLLANVYVHQVLDILSFAASNHRGLRSEGTVESITTTSQHLQPFMPIGSLRQTFQELQQGDESFAPSLQYLLVKVLNLHDKPSNDNKLDSIQDDSSDNEALCHRYHFKYNHKTKQQRRVFWGSLIADDSWHPILLQATESFDLFYSVAFVESNTTQTLTKRKLRFYVDEKVGEESRDAKQRRLRHDALSLLWGSNTKVTVDLYVHNNDSSKDSRENTPSPNAGNKKDKKNGLWLQNENLQRDLIIHRWKADGMTEQDIGIISDVDEVISRDFMRALQVCDGIKPFKRHNHCQAPKLTAPSLVVEGSPHCVVTQRKWQHPDIILGECIDGIVNNDYYMHPVPERAPRYGAMMRLPGWEKLYDDMYFPLWTPTDFRMEDATSFWPAKDTFPVAWHFHNFFDSIESVRNKYLTYGHPVEEAATIPLENISRDLDFMVGCVTGKSERGSALNRKVDVLWMKGDADTKDNAAATTTSAIPRAFQLAPEYPRMRHEELRQFVLDDERSRQQAGALSATDAR